MHLIYSFSSRCIFVFTNICFIDKASGVITTKAFVVQCKIQGVEVEGVFTLGQEALCLHPAFYQLFNLVNA